MNILQHIKYICMDFIKYMDTTYPENVDRVKYTDLKYDNEEEVFKFCTAHNVDKTLLEKLSVRDMMQKTDKDILEEINEYMEVDVV